MSQQWTVQLEEALPADLVSELLGKLYYLSEEMTDIAIAPGRDVVRFGTRSGTADHVEELSRRVRETARVLMEGKLDFQPNVLVDQLRSDWPVTEDPHPWLLQSGQLFEYGPGRYGLGPGSEPGWLEV